MVYGEHHIHPHPYFTNLQSALDGRVGLRARPLGIRPDESDGLPDMTGVGQEGQSHDAFLKNGSRTRGHSGRQRDHRVGSTAPVGKGAVGERVVRLQEARETQKCKTLWGGGGRKHT